MNIPSSERPHNDIIAKGTKSVVSNTPYSFRSTSLLSLP